MKEELLMFCKDYAKLRLERIQEAIEKINESLTSEAKSTAGDKHETGRAMLQLEREKLGKQLSEAEKTAQLVRKLQVGKPSNRVGLGSLVKTDKGNYYISISAGKFEKEGETVYCISPGTPIGKLLLGKSEGEAIAFNNRVFTIQSIG